MLATEEPASPPFMAMNRPAHSSNGSKKPSSIAITGPSNGSSSSRRIFPRTRHHSLNIGSFSKLGRRSKDDSSSVAKPPLPPSTATTTMLTGKWNRNSIAGPIMTTRDYDSKNKPLPPIVDGGDDDFVVVDALSAVVVESKTTLKTGTKGRSGLFVVTEKSPIGSPEQQQQQIPSTPSSPTTESKPHQRRRSFLPSALMTSNLAKFVSGGGSVSASTTPMANSIAPQLFDGPGSAATTDQPIGPFNETLRGRTDFGSKNSRASVPENLILDDKNLLTIEQFKWGVLCCCHAIKNRVLKRKLAQKHRPAPAQVSSFSNSQSHPTSRPPLPTTTTSGSSLSAGSGSSTKSSTTLPSSSSQRKKSTTWTTFNNSIGIKNIIGSISNSTTSNNNTTTYTTHNHNHNAPSIFSTGSQDQLYGGQGVSTATTTPPPTATTTTTTTTTYEARLSEARSTLQALVQVMMESVECNNKIAAASTGSLDTTATANRNTTTNPKHLLSHYSSFPSLHGSAAPATTATTLQQQQQRQQLRSQKSQSRLQLTQATDAILNRLTLQSLIQVLGYTLAIAPLQWIPWHLYDFFERPQGRSFKDLVELLPTQSQRVVLAIMEAVESLIDYGMILEEELEQEKKTASRAKLEEEQQALSMAPEATAQSSSKALRLRTSQGQIRSKNEETVERTAAVGEQVPRTTQSAGSSIRLAMALSVLEPTSALPPSRTSHQRLPLDRDISSTQDRERIRNQNRERRKKVIVESMACLVFRSRKVEEDGTPGAGRGNGTRQQTSSTNSGSSRPKSALPSGDDWSWLRRGGGGGSATLAGSGSVDLRTSFVPLPQPVQQDVSREQKVGQQAFENLVLAYELEQRPKVSSTAVTENTMYSSAMVTEEATNMQNMMGELAVNIQDQHMNGNGNGNGGHHRHQQHQQSHRPYAPKHAQSLPTDLSIMSLTSVQSLSLPPWRKQPQQQQSSPNRVLSRSRSVIGPFVESPSTEISSFNLQRSNTVSTRRTPSASSPALIPSIPVPGSATVAVSPDVALVASTMTGLRTRRGRDGTDSTVRSTWTWSTFQNHMLVMAEEEYLIVDNSSEDGDSDEGEDVEIKGLEIKEGSSSPQLRAQSSPMLTGSGSGASSPPSPVVVRWRKHSETFGNLRRRASDENFFPESSSSS
ncbi:hypothetical protein BGZ83_011332 [Gryganskiella cystojenkinii]|nr:hypothetical protein BGZ83_011332 [Gryganskiella cystojenkinii]